MRIDSRQATASLGSSGVQRAIEALQQPSVL